MELLTTNFKAILSHI